MLIFRLFHLVLYHNQTQRARRGLEGCDGDANQGLFLQEINDQYLAFASRPWYNRYQRVTRAGEAGVCRHSNR